MCGNRVLTVNPRTKSFFFDVEECKTAADNKHFGFCDSGPEYPTKFTSVGAPWRGSANAEPENPLGMNLLCKLGRQTELDDGKCKTVVGEPFNQQNDGYASIAPGYVRDKYAALQAYLEKFGSDEMRASAFMSLPERAKWLADVSICGRGRGHPYRTFCGRGLGGSNAQCFAGFPLRGYGNPMSRTGKHPMYWRGDGSVHITSCRLTLSNAWEHAVGGYEDELRRTTPRDECTKWADCSMFKTGKASSEKVIFATDSKANADADKDTCKVCVSGGDAGKVHITTGMNHFEQACGFADMGAGGNTQELPFEEMGTADKEKMGKWLKNECLIGVQAFEGCMSYVREVAQLQDPVLTNWVLDQLFSKISDKIPGVTVPEACKAENFGSGNVCSEQMLIAIRLVEKGASWAAAAEDVVEDVKSVFCSISWFCSRRRLLSQSGAVFNPISNVKNVGDAFLQVEQAKEKQVKEIESRMTTQEKGFFEEQKPGFLPSALVPLLEAGVASAQCESRYKDDPDPQKGRHKHCPKPVFGEVRNKINRFCKLYPSWISHWAKEWDATGAGTDPHLYGYGTAPTKYEYWRVENVNVLAEPANVTEIAFQNIDGANVPYTYSHVIGHSPQCCTDGCTKKGQDVQCVKAFKGSNCANDGLLATSWCVKQPKAVFTVKFDNKQAIVSATALGLGLGTSGPPGLKLSASEDGDNWVQMGQTLMPQDTVFLDAIKAEQPAAT
jgi:hypothetical protein